jgi:pentatricopeptide repeat protein
MVPATAAYSEDVERDHCSCIMRLSRQGLWREAVAYLGAIERPNAFHFGAALTACEKAGEVAAALAVYESMTRVGVLPDTVTHLPLMRTLLRAGEHRSVLALFVQHEHTCSRYAAGGGSAAGILAAGPCAVAPGARSRHAAGQQPELSLGYSLAIQAAQQLGDWKLVS